MAAGTPSELKALIGDQRIDVIAVDAAGLGRLRAALTQGFDVSLSTEQRMVSIPAPNEIDDLAIVSAAARSSGVPIDEIALRRPTLDDAFLVLTGQLPTTSPTTDNTLEVAR